MMPQETFPDAAQRIMAIVRNVFGAAGIPGSIFKAYFLGLPDNVIIPTDAFPCIIVDKTGGTFKVGPTNADDITEMVYIHILVDVKVGFGAPDDDNFVKRQLQTLVEGRDPNTGYLLPNTLMYGLRKNLTLNTQVVPGLIPINNDINITYDAPKRPNMPETREAVIDITIIERQVVLQRT